MHSIRDKGMALVTALLVLLLVSAIIVGLSWMVMTNQRLSGNNANRQSAGSHRWTQRLRTQSAWEPGRYVADISFI